MKNTKKVTIATLCSILLLGSMSAAVQAASSQSFNSITLKTAAAKAPTDAEKKKMIEAEKARIVQIKKNPGDVYLVYVSDKKLNGGSEFLYYTNFPTFTNYEDYEKYSSTLKGPIIQEPEGMPEGYAFVKGEIQNSIDYKKLEAQVKAEAKGKVVYSKKIESPEVGEIKLEYAKGNDKLFMQIFTIDRNLEKDAKDEGFKYKSADEYDAETKKKNPQFVRNSVSWTEKGVRFTIATNPGNPLTKEELIELAKTMIKK
ncbi:hypothetical protein M3661_14260 [Paenibacillus sp. MER 180]|uniref:hypothetical protein n=1 Tax=Paenibacillus sp. MER 180 TaxID=2939570 RepID=UPI0020423C45|nr:hypothetical protein [Paenibacillus sp. MER 180]MCM3291294.1 hypothetical protein [Paenibacillus sp. MER 180]